MPTDRRVREFVARFLARLRSRGVVHTRHRGITVTDLELLRRYTV